MIIFCCCCLGWRQGEGWHHTGTLPRAVRSLHWQPRRDLQRLLPVRPPRGDRIRAHTLSFHTHSFRHLKLLCQCALCTRQSASQLGSCTGDDKCSTFPRFNPFSFLCFMTNYHHIINLEINLSFTAIPFEACSNPHHTTTHIYVQTSNLKRIDCLLYEIYEN